MQIHDLTWLRSIVIKVPLPDLLHGIAMQENKNLVQLVKLFREIPNNNKAQNVPLLRPNLKKISKANETLFHLTFRNLVANLQLVLVLLKNLVVISIIGQKG